MTSMPTASGRSCRKGVLSTYNGDTEEISQEYVVTGSQVNTVASARQAMDCANTAAVQMHKPVNSTTGPSLVAALCRLRWANKSEYAI